MKRAEARWWVGRRAGDAGWSPAGSQGVVVGVHSTGPRRVWVPARSSTLGSGCLGGGMLAGPCSRGLACCGPGRASGSVVSAGGALVEGQSGSEAGWSWERQRASARFDGVSMPPPSGGGHRQALTLEARFSVLPHTGLQPRQQPASRTGPCRRGRWRSREKHTPAAATVPQFHCQAPPMLVRLPAECLIKRTALGPWCARAVQPSRCCWRLPRRFRSPRARASRAARRRARRRAARRVRASRPSRSTAP